MRRRWSAAFIAEKGGALHFQESQGMGLKRPSAAPCHKFPDLSVGLVAQIVFYLAGILRGGGLGDAQKHKKLGNGLMAVINAAGNGHAAFVECNTAVRVHGDIAIFPQLFSWQC